MPIHPNIPRQRASDIRKWQPCEICKILNSRAVMPKYSDHFACPQCIIDKFGLPRLLCLPNKELRKLRLNDVSMPHMKRVISTLERRERDVSDVDACAARKDGRRCTLLGGHRGGHVSLGNEFQGNVRWGDE